MSSGFLTVNLGNGSGGSGGGGSDTTRRPRIAYDNKGVGAAVTADSTAAGFDPANLFDWKAYTLWTPASDGVHYVTVIPATVPIVDTFALAQHNLGTNGGTVKLQYSLNSGGSWLDATTAIAPTTSNECIFKVFAAITASHWRLEVTSTPASVLGVVFIGASYQPGRGKLEGFAPPTLARKSEQYSTLSESGLFLGRSILRRNIVTEVQFEHLTPTEAYNDWQPFMKHAEKKPFFFCWLYEDYPSDVALMETDGDIPSPTFSRHFALTVSLKMKGLLPV